MDSNEGKNKYLVDLRLEPLRDSFLWLSRSTGYIAYHSLRMPLYVRGMLLITYFIGILLLVLFYTLYRYQKMGKCVLEEEYVFSSIIASSEISTRAFSHYVKNELLGIMAEAEILSQKPEGNSAELTNIRAACGEMYDRLNDLQKNTNRIVLNQSRQNLSKVITKAVEENRALLSQGGCEILWNGENENVVAFVDPYYMREVFRNIFHDSIACYAHFHDAREGFRIGLI